MSSKLNTDIRETIERSIFEHKVDRAEVLRLLDHAREMLDLDAVFWLGNPHYKYRLSVVHASLKNGACAHVRQNTNLSKEEYEHLMDMYIENNISEDASVPFSDTNHDCLLHCGIIYEDVYYGTIGFRHNDESRKWTEDEHESLQVLSYIVMLYILVNGKNKYHIHFDYMLQSLVKDKTVSVYFMNVQTGLCHGLRIADILKDSVSEWTEYSDVLKLFSDKWLDPAYASKMEDKFSLERIQEDLSHENNLMTMDYPRAVKGLPNWFRFTVRMVDVDEEGRPYHALITVENVTQEIKTEALRTKMKEEETQTYAVITSVDLDTQKYSLLVDNRTNEAIDTRSRQIGDYQDLMAYACENAIYPEYVEGFRKRFYFDELKKRMDGGTEKVSYEFPYKLYEQTFWVRLEAIRVMDAETGDRKAICYFQDITEKKQQEKRLEKISIALQEEHRVAEQQKMQLITDLLTGVYNRKGFEELIERPEIKSQAIGFLMIDVDRFKDINDNFGHQTGDEILKTVANLLKKTFREEDKVIRFGGDEFAMILHGCHMSAWESIRNKFERIHRQLRKLVRKDIKVTLSVGMYLSEIGYSEHVIKMADEALYHTKRRGKSGLTLMDENHRDVRFWKDEEVSSDAASREERLLSHWRVEFADDAKQPPRMFGDENTLVKYGISSKLTPEECYRFWTNRIAEEDRRIVEEMVDKLEASGSAECLFNWNHPTDGSVPVRSGATIAQEGAKHVVRGYFQTMSNVDFVFRKEDPQMLLQAINSVNFCSYYLEMETGRYYTFKATSLSEDFQLHEESAEETLQGFLQTLVHPDNMEEMSAFLDLNTLEERMAGVTHIDCEYLSMSEQGWCRARFLPVKWNRDGKLTHVLFLITSIDNEKKRELEQKRIGRENVEIQMQVNSILSKTKAEAIGCVDKVTGDLEFWHGPSVLGEPLKFRFDDVKEWPRKYVADSMQMIYERDLTLEHILKEIEKWGICSMTFEFITEDGEQHLMTYHYADMEANSKKLLCVIEDVTNLVPEGIGWMQEFNVLENLGDAVGIYDYDTYEVVYMNKHGRENLHLTVDDLRGRKCYEVFENRDTPCPFCENLLENARKSNIKMQKLPSGEMIVVRGSMIEVNGKRYRMEQALEFDKEVMKRLISVF